MKITPVILSGGSGTRLWPMSRSLYPKQLQQLTSEKSLLQETLLRLDGLNEVDQPIIICNDEHRFIIQEQLKEIGKSATLILEPIGKNTAPAAVVAALYLQKKQSNNLLMLLPADHFIEGKDKFFKAINAARTLAVKSYLVTFGIGPTKPETGYGYMLKGNQLSSNTFVLSEFVEKPSQEKAKGYLSNGNYCWNSGMFLFSPEAYMREIKLNQPEMMAACSSALEKARIDLNFVRLDQEAFSQSPENSIDYAVMEGAKQAAIVTLDVKWSDVGSWRSLWETLPKEENNNVIKGDVLAYDTSNSYVHAETKLVATIGLNKHIVVETGDAVIVADQDQAQKVKEVVGQLKKNNRSESQVHKKVFRPWGSYQTIDEGACFQVKRITVNPGEKLSLQLHHHRAEHWIIVNGKATVTCGEKVFVLLKNQSTYIPIKTKHRLENREKMPLELIEVQSGDYLGEDDIVRFEDIYQRVEV